MVIIDLIPVRTILQQSWWRFRPWVKSGLVCTLLVATGTAATVSPDASKADAPLFSDFPFDRWAAAPSHDAIKWQVHLLPPVLSVHQRLMERVQAVIPGSELMKRRGRGNLVMLARIEDSDGRQWRDAVRLDLTKVQSGVKSQELTFSLSSFVQPGDYTVEVALVDTGSADHNFSRRTLHVPGIKSDPLPQSWVGLPPVESLPAVDGPDAWFLPNIKGLLQLPVYQPFDSDTAKLTKSAPRVDLLVNITPSARFAGSPGMLRRNMSVVIPALKVLSGLNAKVRPPSAAVLDLTKHQVGFQATNAAALDWNALGSLFTASNPSVIDAQALARQATMRDYLADEVATRAGAAGPPRWLIVLSTPLNFNQQEESALPELPADPNRHIVYFRFSSGFSGGIAPLGRGPGPDARIAPAERVHGPVEGLGTIIPAAPGRGRGGPPPDLFPDDMERILKAMGAEVISVTNPESFRKGIASLIQEMAHSGTLQTASN